MNHINKGVHLTDEQQLDWLRLIRSPNVGPRTFRTRAALEALPSLARRRERHAASCVTPPAPA